MIYYRSEKTGHFHHYIVYYLMNGHGRRIRCKYFMPSFTFAEAVQWAGLETLRSQFWPAGLMFDTCALDFTSVNLIH